MVKQGKQRDKGIVTRGRDKGTVLLTPYFCCDIFVLGGGQECREVRESKAKLECIT